MSLRVRLVAALGLLLTIGLVLFGFGTYSWYARSQRDRLDQNVQAAVPIAARRLTNDTAGSRFPPLPEGSGGGFDPEGRGQQRPGPSDTYAALLNPDGTIVRDTGTLLLRPARPAVHVPQGRALPRPRLVRRIR